MTPSAPSKQAAKPIANSCSGLVPPPSPPISVGQAEVDLERAVGGAPVALGAPAGDVGPCAV